MSSYFYFLLKYNKCILSSINGNSLSSISGNPVTLFVMTKTIITSFGGESVINHNIPIARLVHIVYRFLCSKGGELEAFLLILI